MATVTVKCPSCQAATEINNDKEKAFCSFCGAEINPAEAEPVTDAPQQPAQQQPVTQQPAPQQQMPPQPMHAHSGMAENAFANGQLDIAYKEFCREIEMDSSRPLPHLRKAECAFLMSNPMLQKTDEVKTETETAVSLASAEERDGLVKDLVNTVIGAKFPTPPKDAGEFPSMNACSMFLSTANSRLLLLDSLYTSVLRGATEDAVNFVSEILSLCKTVNTTPYKYKDETGENTVNYKMPSDIAKNVRKFKKKYTKEYVALTRPQLDQIAADITKIKENMKASPALPKILHYLVSWPVLALFVIITAGYFWKKFLLYVGGALLVILLAAFLVHKFNGSCKNYESLATELKERKALAKEIKIRNK